MLSTSMHGVVFKAIIQNKKASAGDVVRMSTASRSSGVDRPARSEDVGEGAHEHAEIAIKRHALVQRLLAS